jgi:hypothetical protein
MKMRPDPTCRNILSLLNRAVTLDPAAIRRLVNHRVACSEQMADDCYIQCRQKGKGPVKVGFLGLMNGITQPRGYRLEAMFEAASPLEAGILISFRLVDMKTLEQGEPK